MTLSEICKQAQPGVMFSRKKYRGSPVFARKFCVGASGQVWQDLARPLEICIEDITATDWEFVDPPKPVRTEIPLVVTQWNWAHDGQYTLYTLRSVYTANTPTSQARLLLSTCSVALP